MTNDKLKREQRAAEIIGQLKTCLPAVMAGYPVDMAYLHGSVARGCPLPASDIDIALVLTAVPPPYDRLKLELAIQAALEDACRLPNMDVRTINQAPIMVQGPIVQEGILLYSRDKERRVAFEVLTRKKYFDFRPRAEFMQQAYLDRIRREGLTRGQAKNRRRHSEYPGKLSE